MTAMTRRGAILGAAGLLATRPALAAGYPERPVRIVVPFAPAGPTDIIARVMAAHLGDRLGGSFIVDNRPGAGSNIGTAFVARAEPDGYTLLVTSSAFVVNPGLYKRVPYDPSTDFAGIAELGTSPNVFLASPASGIKTMAELIAKAKADPDALSYASAGIGTTPHLSGELLKLDAGIKMTHVPFAGGGPAIEAVMANTTPIACVSLPPATPLIASGALIALAVTSAERWFDLPNVPTMVELGYQGFITETLQAFLAPAKTPPPIVEALVRATLDILHDKPVADQLEKNGFQVLAKGPDGLQQWVGAEVPKWRTLIQKFGIQPI